MVGTQSAARMKAHCRVDGGRSHGKILAVNTSGMLTEMRLMEVEPKAKTESRWER